MTTTTPEGFLKRIDHLERVEFEVDASGIGLLTLARPDRLNAFDFDMLQYNWDQSLSPGNEQAFYWSSAAAADSGSRNYAGGRSKAADALIAVLVQARERADVVAATRALDRVLISGFYAIPLFHLPENWIARWSTVAHPAKTSLMGDIPETWWREPPKQ